jgi:hypothetical protein
MRTKEFNLEEALNGAKVVTRDGREVTQLTKFESKEQYNVYGVVNNGINWWRDDGSAWEEGESPLDLFLAVEPKSVWMNIYLSDLGGLMTSSPCSSKEQAIQTITKGAYYSYLKTIEITDEP